MKAKFEDFQIVPIIDSIKRADISDELYFSSKYSNYISNSRLKYIDPKDNGSPELFLNPPHFTTSSLNIGSAVHECLLQPDSFVLGPKLHKPTAKLGQVADYVYSHRSNDIPIEDTIREASQRIGYYVNQINSKIPSIIEKCTPYWNGLDEPRWKKQDVQEIFLSDSDYDIVSGCLESCFNNKQIMDKLEEQLANSAARTWWWIHRVPKNTRDMKYSKEVSSFVKANFPLFGKRNWKPYLRFSVFLARFPNSLSFAVGYMLNSFPRRIGRREN